MGELLSDALTVMLIAAGGIIIAYLVWVTATSTAFVTISLMSLITAVFALVLVVAVLALIGALVWWIALLITVVVSGALFAGLYPVAKFGLTRLKTQLKEAFPSHWGEGEASGKMTAESLTAPPSSLEEARRMQKETGDLAEKAHVTQHHDDAGDLCPAFGLAFQDAFWDSLRSSGVASDWTRRRASRHVVWHRRRT
jgi:hypothetical protein